VTLGIGLARVSTGSQDEASQVRDLTDGAAERGITLVKIIKLHGYSASHGMQEPALQEIIAGMERGDWSTLLVTDSSRIDRREDLDAQAAVLLAIRSAGGDVISLTEPNYGQTDFAGRIVTLVAQHANAEKSKTVKNSTYRGISMIRDNNAHHGALPSFWATRGERYAKQAFCTDPEAVRDIYERVAGGEPLLSIARSYGLYPASVKTLIRFAANHTGVEECRYTHEGVTETWAHEVTPVVDSPLWWRANKVLAANMTDARENKGGRPVAQPANWISGVLDCPECGGKLFLNAGKTPAGNPRTPKLRCGGNARERQACGRFKGCDAQPVIDGVTGMFANDTTKVQAFQRVAGNAHELEALKAELRKIQARLSATEDDDALDALVAQRKAVRARIEGFALVPDDFDYAPTKQTVAQMWNDGDDTVKRGIVRAAKKSWGMILAKHEGQWVIDIGKADSKSTGDANGIVDLGNGLCFRREAA
jgi:DNA invertase Pin-like site-specific DNA recombinase